MDEWWYNNYNNKNISIYIAAFARGCKALLPIITVSGKLSQPASQSYSFTEGCYWPSAHLILLLLIIIMGSYNARLIYPIGHSRRLCGATAALIRQPENHRPSQRGTRNTEQSFMGRGPIFPDTVIIGSSALHPLAYFPWPIAPWCAQVDEAIEINASFRLAWRLPLRRLIIACSFRVSALSGHAALVLSPNGISSELSAVCRCG